MGLKAALEHKTWNVILCDYTMPDFSGAEALALVRRSRPDVPFIFVSGTMGEDVAVEALKAGSHDYVMKDNLKRLVPAIERALRDCQVCQQNRQAEQLLALRTGALEAAANAVVITDRDGRIQWVNPAFTKLTGYSAEAVVGQNPRLLKSDQHKPAFYADLWRTILAGEVWHGELINRRKNGDHYTEEQTITPVRDSTGQVTHFISIKQDITARKMGEARLHQQAEALTASNAELQQFNRLAVGRELRTVEIKTEVNQLCLRLGQQPRYDLNSAEILAQKAKPIPLALVPNVPEMKNRRILVVDDNPSVHDDFRKILERPRRVEETDTDFFAKEQKEQTPFKIDCTARGEDGLKLVQQAVAEGRPYGLAFMDVRMAPGWDGVETTRRIWEVQADLQIVLCTAHSDYSLGKLRANLGQSDRLLVLKKPFDVIEVVQLAHTLLEKWRLGRNSERKLTELEAAVLERTREIEASRGAALNMMADAVEARVALERTNRDLEKQIRERERAEAALRESEERLRLALDAAHMGTFDWDMPQNRISWSRSHEELWGFQPGEFGGTYEAFAQRLHPDDLPGVNAEVARCIAAREPFIAEFRVVWPDGSVHWVYARGEFAFDANGQPLRMRGAAFEVTARRLAEMAQAAQALRYKTLMELSSDSIHILDERGNLLEANLAFYRGLGYTPAEMEGMHVANWDADFTREELGERVRDVMDKCLIFETRHRRKNSTVFEVEASVTGIRIEDRPVLYCATRDITERKKAEENLREQAVQLARSNENLRQAEEKYRSIFENSAEGLFQTTPDGRLLEANPAMARILGYDSSAEIMRERDSIAGSGCVNTADCLEFQRLLAATGAVHDFEYEVYRKDQRKVWISQNTHAVRNERGEIVRYEGSFSDITERKRMEQQLHQAQKMEAVGQLAGGIAHDFNNLLVVINGFSNLLLDSGRLSGEDAETLKQVYLAGERAANLTRQLLTFSRRQAVQMDVMDLNNVVNGISKMLQRVIGEDIQLEVRNTETQASIRADAGMIEQILLNLAVNARDAMPRGGRLTISLALMEIPPSAPKAQPNARPGWFVALSVKDTGCGMSPAVASHIFEPFFTTKPVGKGTGMGLATVYGIVEQHQGWIEVDSGVDAGATFTVFLPLVVSPAVISGAALKHKPVVGGKEMILVVEDEEAVRCLAVIVLKKYGYRVLEAGSGPEALEVWERHGPKIDLVITDMVMPGDMTGRELTEALKVSKPGLKVIYSSGYSPDMMSQSFGQMANVPFLQKPYTPTRLGEAVRQALDEKA